MAPILVVVLIPTLTPPLARRSSLTHPNQAFELLNRACMPPGQHNASANNSLLEDSLLDHLSMTDEQTADLAGDRLFDM